MNLDNLKRLASEKGREYWVDDVLTDSPYSKAWRNSQDGEEKCIGRAIHVTESAHAEKLAQALSKMIEVVSVMESAMWFVKSELLDQDKIYNHPLHSLEDRLEEALTRANDLIGGI